MTTLSDFHAPQNISLATTCERNAALINDENPVVDYYRIPLRNCVHNQRKNIACLETACKQAFLAYHETIFDKIHKRWTLEGISGVLNELSDCEEVPSSANRLVVKLLRCVTYVQSLVRDWNAAKQIDTKHNQKRVMMACHAHTSRVALVMEDDTIKVLDINCLNDGGMFLLKDKRISSISCFAWMPRSAMSLAVGGKNGVLLWRLDPNVNTVRPSANSTRLFCADDMRSGVSWLSWCPDGDLLASSCHNSSTIWIWSAITEQCTSIYRAGSSISHLMWSPCGGKLLAATNTDMFRVWETETWTCEKWSGLNGKCTNTCWSSCGKYLLFTVANEPFIYYVHFYTDSNNQLSDVCGSGVALKCADLTASTWSDDLKIGGLVSNMAWDPTDSRLAVSFKDESYPFIALFHAQTLPILRLTPCGFVNGLPGDVPLSFDFVQGYTKGAWLSVLWSSETVSMIPLFYNLQHDTSPLQYLSNRGNLRADGNLAETTTLHCAGLDASLYSPMR